MIDYARDKNNAEFYKLHKMNEIPSFVKEAHLMEEGQLTKLAGSQFADSVMRMFPISSKAETWLSAAYMTKQAAEGEYIRPDVQNALDSACELYGLDVSGITTSMHEKEASDYITIQYRDDKAVHASVPVQEGEHLDKIASDILTPGNHNYGIRRNVARQVLGAAQVMGHYFSEAIGYDLEKTAGYGVTSLDNVKTAIQQRRCAIEGALPKHVESMNELTKYATDMADAQGIVGGSNLEKIAAVLDAVDRQAGLTIKYGDSFRTPELQLFSICRSQIEGYNQGLIKLANGRSFMMGRFNHGKVCDFLTDVFDKEATDLKASMEELSARQADQLSRYIDKAAKDFKEIGQAADELEVPDNSPVEEDEIKSEHKADPVEGQDNISDESCPREDNNEDSTPRAATA